jgi:hypothetical protein
VDWRLAVARPVKEGAGVAVERGALSVGETEGLRVRALALGQPLNVRGAVAGAVRVYAALLLASALPAAEAVKLGRSGEGEAEGEAEILPTRRPTPPPPPLLLALPLPPPALALAATLKPAVLVAQPLPVAAPKLALLQALPSAETVAAVPLRSAETEALA